MKMLHLLVQLLVTLIFLSQHMSLTIEPVSATLAVISVIEKIGKAVLAAWDSVQLTEEGKTKFQLINEKQREVLNSLKQVSIQIDQTEAQHSQYMAMATDSVNSFIGQNVPLILKFNDIMDTMNRISSRYQLMMRYEVRREKLEVSTLITFAEWTISPNPYSVSQLMDRLHLNLFSNGKGNLNSSLAGNVLSHLVENYKESNEMCRTMQSVQQFLYTLYTDIALTELKGYTMVEFSLMILRIYGRGNFSEEADLMRWDYQTRTEHAVNLLRKIMRASDRVIWRCDPVKHIPEVTYDEVTRLLQGYIENEVDLNSEGTCRHNCAYYDSARSEGCYQSLYCSEQQRCWGNVHNCEFIESHMRVCQAPRSSNRRYEYIEYKNGRLLGQRQKCGRGITNDVESWWRWIFWHCSYCFCLCDEQGWKSDRFFNLRESVADVNDNKVVTGVRFIKKNRVFHLQIQQGQMLPRGAINESTIEWKPVDEYYVYDKKIQKGVDYHSLNYSSLSIDLDDLMKTDTNSNFVLTGVRFHVLGSHLNLMAQFCKFDFKSGKLLQPEHNCVWEYNDAESREKLNLDDLDVPTRSTARSNPLSKRNQYLEFVNSGMDQDAAQTTLPFIDIQDVVSNPPVPLAGVGIFYKSRPGYGGFVAPKIFTYDFSPHVQVPKTNS